MNKYSLSELEAMPTLSVSQAEDLKVDDGYRRVWLSRCDPHDGEPYANKVTVETWNGHRWVEIEEYEAC